VNTEKVVFVVTLGGDESGVSYETTEEFFVEAVGCSGSGDDVFLHHDGTHVVGAEVEGDLADVRSHGDPTGADGVDVIEEESADCLRAKVIGGAGHSGGFAEFRMDIAGCALIAGERSGGGIPFGESTERGVFALEWPGDECFVSTSAVPCEVFDGSILPIADSVEVIDAVGDSFDVAEHHGCGGVHTEFVCNAHDGEPGISGTLSEADFFADGFSEDFATSTGE